jgi:hypothetical protein
MTDKRPAYIRLHARDLFYKNGFDDGDILEPLFRDHPDPFWSRDEDHLPFEHEVLARCVERFLLPFIGMGVETVRIATCHNPIRTLDEQIVPASLVYLYVDVSAGQVMSIADEVTGEWSSAGDGQTET